MTFLKFQISDYWSIEGGVSARAQQTAWFNSSDCPVGFEPFHYQSKYLDLPFIVELHALGKRKFNFNLLGGIEETWQFAAVVLNDPSSAEGPYKYTSTGIAFMYGFKEAYKISPRLKVCAQQTPTIYFSGDLKGSSGSELSLGIEYLLR